MNKTNKQFSVTKVYLLILMLIIVGFIILITSGTFDKPTFIPNQQTAQQSQGMNNPHSGADMSQLKLISDLEKQFEKYPDDYETLERLAHLLNDSGFFNKAIEKYKLYLQKFPDNADMRVDMGVCYFEMKQFDMAISQMKEALKYQPTHQIAHLNIGVVNYSAGNIDEAMNWWKKAVELGPDSPYGKRAKELIETNQ